MLKLVYAVFLGLVLSILVGVGIAAFYPTPPAPQPPLLNVQKEPTSAQLEQEQAFERQRQNYESTQLVPYNRNVSLLVLGFAIVFLAIGLLFDRRIQVIADGVMLGGVFSLFYSIGRSFASQNSKFSFIVVAIAVLVAIFLGYWRFLRRQPGAS